MKINKLATCFVTASLMAFMFGGCDDNIPPYVPVEVEDVQLGEDLRGGLTLEVNETYDISYKVIVTPEESTEKAENYSSSDTEVASVDAYGILTAIKPGTSTITITVGGKSASFPLTVQTIVERPFESLSFGVSQAFLKVGEPYDVAPLVVSTPSNSNDRMKFTSSDPSIFSVTETGILSGHKIGEATLTVSSTYDPSITAQLTVTVNIIDYDRSDWTVVDTNPALFVASGAEVNNTECLFNGDPQNNVFMALVRPSKSFNGVSNPSKEQGGYTQFTVDMKKSQKVNYFRLGFRSGNIQLRFYRMQKIYGSNDYVIWDDITTDFVDVPGAANDAVTESSNVRIPTTEYRYYRFWCQDDSCWKSISEGASVQTTQFWMGYDSRWE